MVERICSQCQYGNPLENRFCGRCGASLDRTHQLPPPEETNLTVAGQTLPVSMQQVGRALAVSLAALAAEAGLLWLRRRVEQMKHQPSLSLTAPQTTQIIQSPTSSTPPIVLTSSPQDVTIQSHRVIEVWEHGILARQTIERIIWRRER